MYVILLAILFENTCKATFFVDIWSAAFFKFHRARIPDTKSSKYFKTFAWQAYYGINATVCGPIFFNGISIRVKVRDHIRMVSFRRLTALGFWYLCSRSKYPIIEYRKLIKYTKKYRRGTWLKCFSSTDSEAKIIFITGNKNCSSVSRAKSLVSG